MTTDATSTTADDEWTDTDLGATVGWDEDDIGDLRVNFSKEEAEAESLENIPPGKYLAAITNVKVKRSKSEKNDGKPYYAIEFTIQEGKYANRKVYTNVMLFEGALYSLSQLMKALGLETSQGSVKVPTAEELLDEMLIVRVKITPQRTVGDKTYDARNDINGYFPMNRQSLTAVRSSGSEDLEP